MPAASARVSPVDHRYLTSLGGMAASPPHRPCREEAFSAQHRGFSGHPRLPGRPLSCRLGPLSSATVEPEPGAATVEPEPGPLSSPASAAEANTSAPVAPPPTANLSVTPSIFLAEAKRNKDNQESKKRGRATYTGGSRSMVRAKERVRARIEESGGSSSALKEYLGTHATLVDPGADTYSCTYPDTQTQEYCFDDWILSKGHMLNIKMSLRLYVNSLYLIQFIPLNAFKPRMSLYFLNISCANPFSMLPELP
ncbi:uncharacterized protein A4U43_C08F12120 [Asparagus officinalis]|nr:uncharacterized protein A4U43_C08F12120 [Asparagus officinalis]